MKEIIKVDLESFKNLTNMLNSKDKDDMNLALETIKNLNPSEELVRLFLKKVKYHGRRELIEILGKEVWSFNDLTMSKVYERIKNSDNSNKDNLKIIYESLVKEHFDDLFDDFDFINAKLEIEW